MNNGIEIDIIITMGDTCSNTMTLAEARALYVTLGDLFGNENPKSVNIIEEKPRVKGKVTARGQVDQSVNHETPTIAQAEAMEAKSRLEAKAKADAQAKSAIQEKRDRLKEAVQPNPKVEAARNKAAERTRGCGSR